MLKIALSIFIAVCLIFSVSACTKSNEDTKADAANTTPSVDTSSVESELPWGAGNALPIVKINGKLYYYHTSQEIAPTPTKEQIVGKIESVCEQGDDWRDRIQDGQGLWDYPDIIGAEYAIVDGEVLLYAFNGWRYCKEVE